MTTKGTLKMLTRETGNFFTHFGILKDTRQEGKIKHLLTDILFIAVAATLCGMDEWEDIEEWALAKEDWLTKHIQLPNGIPSYHTYRRVFGVIDPKQFEKCFIEWMKEATEMVEGTVVAIDGKTMRGTAEKKSGKKGLHIVSAWCSENNLVLGQVKTNEKSNEITAIPELLDLLFLKGAIVTIDAMGTQKEIAKKIVKEKKAEYVLSLKDNQPTLREEVEKYYKDAVESPIKSDMDNITVVRTKEKGHGRIEERIYSYTTDVNWMDARKDWENLNGIGKVVRKIEQNGIKTEETHFYISSLSNTNDFAKSVRSHWGIESTHWNLDVTFSEDANRTRKDNAPENLAMLKRLALNMLRKDCLRYPKKSANKKRTVCLLYSDYLEYIFNINFK